MAKVTFEKFGIQTLGPKVILAKSIGPCNLKNRICFFRETVRGFKIRPVIQLKMFEMNSQGAIKMAFKFHPNSWSHGE